MHFSKIYIQKNFVPNQSLDPFGRESIGVEIYLNEGDSIINGKELAREYIKEYIYKNTVDQPHIVERYIADEQLPDIQVDNKEIKESTLAEQIAACTEITVLESYKLIVKKDPLLQLEYDKKMYILQYLNKLCVSGG